MTCKTCLEITRHFNLSSHSAGSMMNQNSKEINEILNYLAIYRQRGNTMFILINEKALPEINDFMTACYSVMKQLRDNIEPDEFAARIARQIKAGYQLLALLEHDTIVALAGFRYKETLSMGKFIYIDDLITDENHRHQGYASRLLHKIEEIGQETGVTKIRLDSGIQRKDAHKFYLQNGFEITGHVFISKGGKS